MTVCCGVAGTEVGDFEHNGAEDLGSGDADMVDGVAEAAAETLAGNATDGAAETLVGNVADGAAETLE